MKSATPTITSRSPSTSETAIATPLSHAPAPWIRIRDRHQPHSLQRAAALRSSSRDCSPNSNHHATNGRPRRSLRRRHLRQRGPGGPRILEAVARRRPGHRLWPFMRMARPGMCGLATHSGRRDLVLRAAGDTIWLRSSRTAHRGLPPMTPPARGDEVRGADHVVVLSDQTKGTSGTSLVAESSTASDCADQPGRYVTEGITLYRCLGIFTSGLGQNGRA